MPFSFPALCHPSQVLQNLDPFNSDSCNGLITLGLTATVAVSATYLLYTKYFRESYVDQLFSNRITNIGPSLEAGLDGYLKSKGYNYLTAVSSEGLNLPEPLEQVIQYTENPRQFDKAVAEFAKFTLENDVVVGIDACTLIPDFFHIDLWGNPSPEYVALSLSEIANCQSFPLFMQAGEGKIGIRDPNIKIFDDPKMKMLAMQLFPTVKQATYSIWKSLFGSFPYHQEIITDVLKRIYPEIDIDNYSLNKQVASAKKVLEAFKKIYPAYVQWKTKQKFD